MMTSGTVSFEETLFKRYNMYVWEEKQHKEKLRTVLEELIGCKDEDEIELIEEKIEGLEEEVEFLQGKQKDITVEILRDVRYGH